MNIDNITSCLWQLQFTRANCIPKNSIILCTYRALSTIPASQVPTCYRAGSCRIVLSSIVHHTYYLYSLATRLKKRSHIIQHSIMWSKNSGRLPSNMAMDNSLPEIDLYDSSKERKMYENMGDPQQSNHVGLSQVCYNTHAIPTKQCRIISQVLQTLQNPHLQILASSFR